MLLGQHLLVLLEQVLPAPSLENLPLDLLPVLLERQEKHSRCLCQHLLVLLEEQVLLLEQVLVLLLPGQVLQVQGQGVGDHSDLVGRIGVSWSWILPDQA